MNRLRPRHRPAGPAASTPRRALAATALLAGLSGLAGCSTTPPTRLHSLLTGPGQASGPAGTQPAVLARLATLQLPLAVDQAPWLVRLPDQSLRVLEQERWTSPLREELRTALQDQLVRQWGLHEPVVSGAAAGTVWRIELDLQRFESLPGRLAWQSGQFSLTAAAAPGQPPRPGLRCPFSLQQPVADGPLALAEGHRQALARLAALIGQGLQDLAAGRPARCTAD